MSLIAASLCTSLSAGIAGAAADAIPGQVPPVTYVRAEPLEQRRLRGDFEAPPWVVVSYSPLWPRTLVSLGEQVLASGAGLLVVRDQDSSRREVERWAAQLTGAQAGTLELFDEAIDTPWVRDWGPLQLRDGEAPLWIDAAVVGGQSGRQRDELAPQWLAKRHAVKLESLDWMIDGGALISNGQGLCVLTREFVSAAVTSADPSDAGSWLARLGCVLSVIVPTLVDEQTKHADVIAQFVSPTRVMVAAIAEQAGRGPSEDALRMDEAAAGILAGARMLGQELELVRVPTPASVAGSNPRSYVNGLRLSDRYLMPSYPKLGARSEEAARSAVQAALGEVPVVSLDSSAMIAAGGAIHCASLGLFTP